MFLNNLLRCQNISDEHKSVTGCIPTWTMDYYQERNLQDLVSLLCTWTEPVLCNENDEGKICRFVPSTYQMVFTNQEEFIKYIAASWSELDKFRSYFPFQATVPQRSRRKSCKDRKRERRFKILYTGPQQ